MSILVILLSMKKSCLMAMQKNIRIKLITNNSLLFNLLKHRQKLKMFDFGLLSLVDRVLKRFLRFEVSTTINFLSKLLLLSMTPMVQIKIMK